MAKGIMIIAVFAILALVAIVNFPTDNSEANEKQIIADSMAEIDLYCQKLMFPQAKSVYASLAQANLSNEEIINGYIDFCVEHGYVKEAQDICVQLLSINEQNKPIAERLLEICYSADLTDVYKYMDSYKELTKDTEIYSKIKSESAGKYKYIGTYYESVDDWSVKDYAYIYSDGGKTGVVNSSGKETVAPVFDYICSYSPSLNYIAIKDHDQLVYSTSEGQRALVPYNRSDKELIYLDYAGTYENGFANINNGGVWSYANETMGIGNMQYEETAPFYNGISAVKENGKWSLIDTSFNPILNAAYNDIYLDQYGGFMFGNLIYLDSGSGWQAYKLTKETTEDSVSYKIDFIQSDAFDEVRPFGEYGAVKKNGKWGFIRNDGTWLIEPKYEDAYSFRCGLAPVKKEGKWGFISEDGSTAIDFTFDNAVSLNSNGCSAVKSGDKWKFIQLLEYYYIGR